MNLRHTFRRLARCVPVAGLGIALLATGRAGAPAVEAQPPATDLAAARAALAARPFAAAGPVARTLTVADVPPADLVSGRATVTFAPDVTDEQARGAIAAAGGSALLAIPHLNTYEVALPPGDSVADGIAALSALPGVQRAEPEERLESAFHPNDPLYGPYQSYLPLLHAEQAWDIQQGDPRITVAVLDSGVDITHPDLAGQIWQNPNPGAWGCGDDEHGCNFVDPRDVDPSCPNL